MLHKPDTIEARVGVVLLKCFEETINWNDHQTTDGSAEIATKGAMSGRGCMYVT